MAARSARPEPPLVVIAGPTASGKTSLAISLAKQFGGEIICADSRTVYQGMDIGTAKPTVSEQVGVSHWGLDLVEPGMTFTAADFKQYALAKIAEIRARGNVPFIVGGTGLYIDGVIFNYQFGALADEGQRAQWEKMTIEELHNYCNKNDIVLPENSHNRRYVIRAIEQKSINTKRSDAPAPNTIVVGIATKKDILRTRIIQRSEQLFDDGMVEEATILGKKYGWESEAMTGNVYPLVRKFLAGELSREQLVQEFITSDWRLAKRQMTWLRRNEHILWLTLADAEHFLAQKLAQRHNP
jgi:tRNA dimethylallyltransferase